MWRFFHGQIMYFFAFNFSINTNYIDLGQLADPSLSSSKFLYFHTLFKKILVKNRPPFLRETIHQCGHCSSVGFLNEQFTEERIHFCRIDNPYVSYVEITLYGNQYIPCGNRGTSPKHPEGTSIGSDNCDFLKVSDFNGSLWNVKVFPQLIF